MARGKVWNFAFLTSSGGKFYDFFVTFVLVIHPLTVKNRPCALIWACALNRKNTASQWQIQDFCADKFVLFKFVLNEGFLFEQIALPAGIYSIMFTPLPSNIC